MLVLLGLVWGSVVVAASVNPSYAHRRDYISALASIGASHAWLGVLAIAAFGVAFVLTASLVRPLSRTAAVTVAAAGAGVLFVAFARIRCVGGAAYCGVGDRSEIDLQGTRATLHGWRKGARFCFWWWR